MNRDPIMTLPAPSGHAAWPRRLEMAAWACCCALLVARSALATNYFVATNGNDTMNSGLSNSAPWQTIGAWSSVTNHTYRVYASSNLLYGFPTLLTNVGGTPPTNSFLDTNLTLGIRFYRVTVTN